MSGWEFMGCSEDEEAEVRMNMSVSSSSLAGFLWNISEGDLADARSAI